MREALIRAGIKFIEQYIVPGVGIPDFFLPDINAIVYCDGDYWHSLPHHVIKDAKQTTDLKRMGYTVFRFLGSKIIEDSDLCVSFLTHH